MKSLRNGEIDTERLFHAMVGHRFASRNMTFEAQLIVDISGNFRTEVVGSGQGFLPHLRGRAKKVWLVQQLPHPAHLILKRDPGRWSNMGQPVVGQLPHMSTLTVMLDRVS